ncbi:hypothetical protein O3S68_21815 [Kosakonia sp. SOY2]|uniref:hypothetical protein n=1 Tax=Kosakonia sp. SOY2 TaxID=3014557 RepID=UPI0022ABE40A|nr:hypothetical protein [Kosakonia sp. SOY2]MCZ3384921.1 hypothetical protein [Kosakonia sp. SOY2]
MEIEEISIRFKALKQKSKNTFFQNLLSLFNQIESALILEGPYRLVLDSNIILRLESYRQGNVSEGLLSILLAFKLIKKLPFHFDLVVRPTVFYEYLRQKNLKNTHEHWIKFKELKNLIEEELGAKLFFDGIETYPGAEHFLQLIQNDAKKIKKTLIAYQNENWHINFIQRAGSGVAGFPITGTGYILVPPAFAADALFYPLGLEYFDETKSSRFFTQYIHKYIIECKSNDRDVINKYNNEKDFLFTQILKLTSKGNLMGLADLDIYTNCNIQSQFSNQSHSRYAPASAALTIDGKLARALRNSNSHHITSGGMICGPENENDNNAKMEAFIEEHKRMRESEERHRIAIEASREFIKELLLSGAFSD